MNKPISRIILALAAFSFVALTSLRAEVIPHALFSEGAVLQQKMNVPIWGTAKDGEKVSVEFQKQKISAVAKNGEWKVQFKPLRAGGPFTLKISGENTIVLTNILVGEVWVCSGQSNMQMGLAGCAGAKEAIANSEDPMMRVLTVPSTTSDKPERNVKASWSVCGPNSVPGFSGVAYFFGRDLRKALKVPVGLIHSSWGGTIAEAWTTRQALAADPSLKPMLDAYDQTLENYPKQMEQYKQAEPELNKKYEEDAAKAKAEGKNPPRAPAPPANPVHNPNHPCALYNAMIAPLQPFAIRGAIWYQGESNAGRAFQYRTLFPTMIRSWRETWGQGDFPFFFVQLAPYGSAAAPGGNSAWAELREAQLLTSQNLAKTGMAVITDAGDCGDIHPVRKEPAGARLALAARAIAYGERIEYSGPSYDSMKTNGDRVTLTFKHVGGGLVAKDGELKGFIIAGEDKKFVSAKAEIKGNKIVVWSADVPKPAIVRYGWADCPDVNLFNKEGLPASPFRTDGVPTTTGLK